MLVRCVCLVLFVACYLLLVWLVDFVLIVVFAVLIVLCLLFGIARLLLLCFGYFVCFCLFGLVWLFAWVVGRLLFFLVCGFLCLVFMFCLFDC